MECGFIPRLFVGLQSCSGRSGGGQELKKMVVVVGGQKDRLTHILIICLTVSYGGRSRQPDHGF